AANQFKSQLLRRYSQVIQKSGEWAPREERTGPRVVVIEWTEPLMTAGNWTPELVKAAGGNSVLAESGQPSDYLTWLDVVAARPEVLIIAPCGFNLERSMIEAQRLADLPG